MIRSWFWSLLWVVILAAALQGQSRESVLKAVQQTSKWSPADKPVQYDDKNIASLDAKRAAAIHRYGLIGVTIQDWTGTEGAARRTLYEMLDARAAYGQFPLDRK